ncbi:MAG: restriction endonuclease subunit S [Prevotellaceae bacterium]|nr:restriction endonuclease subunit S [Candidatus Colivivens equi]
MMIKIDTSKWKPFKIDDLFYKLELKCLKKEFNKSFDVSEIRTEEFDLPLVNAKHFNNGIMYYGRSSDFESDEMTIDIVCDGAASTGDVYAQPQRTGVLYNAYLVKPKFVCNSECLLHYFAIVIEKCVKDHFGYDEKCTWDKVKKETIMLPVDSNGEPDWKYMENYMKTIEDKVCKSLSMLEKVCK